MARQTKAWYVCQCASWRAEVGKVEGVVEQLGGMVQVKRELGRGLVGEGWRGGEERTLVRKGGRLLRWARTGVSGLTSWSWSLLKHSDTV